MLTSLQWHFGVKFRTCVSFGIELTDGNYVSNKSLNVITIFLPVFTVCPWFSADNGSTSTITSGPQNLPQFEVSALFISLTPAFQLDGKK